jgi:hypothetical protein
MGAPYSSSLTCRPHVTGLGVVVLLHGDVGHEAVGRGAVTADERPLTSALPLSL